MRKHDSRQNLPSLIIITLLCLGAFAFTTFNNPSAAASSVWQDEKSLLRHGGPDDVIISEGNSSAGNDVYAKTNIGTVISTNDINNPTKTIITKDKAVKMSVTGGSKGFFHPQRWMMVECVLENSGPPIDGYIEVITGPNGPEPGMMPSTINRKKLDLPRGARKKVELNVLVEDPFITVRYVAGSKILLRTSLRPRWIDPMFDIIGVITREDSNLNLFKDITAAKRGSEYALFNDPSELPESDLGLNAMDILVVNGVSTQRLSSRQKTAVLNWVRDGGTLVLSGGADAAKTIAGLPRELVPVTLGANITSPGLPAALKLTDSYVEQGPYSYAKVSNYQGEVILGDKQTPLATHKNLGKGSVVWVAFDLGSRPFSEWRGNEAFWSRIMSHREMRNNYSSMYSLYGMFSGLLYNISSLKAPSLSYVMLFLFLYLILVSPLNYLVLKKLDKREWAWVTIPLFIVIFGSASYWYAYITKGGDVIVNQVGVLDVSPDEPNARLYNVFGIFSPGKTSYTIKLPSGMSGSPTPGFFGPGPMGSLDPAILDLSDQPQISDFNVAAWTMRSFIATGRISFDNKIASNLRYTKAGIDGSIKNNLSYPLTDAFLIDGKRIHKIGTLKPGATKTIAVKYSKTVPANGAMGERLFFAGKKGRFGMMRGPESYSQGMMLKMEMINQMLGYEGENLPKSPTLVAWAPQPLVTPEISGKKPIYRGHTMLLLPVDIDSTDYFVANPRQMRRTMVDKTGTIRNYGPGFFAFNKTVEFEYRLPIDRAYTPVSATLLSSPMGPPRFYKTYVYNFKRDGWNEFKLFKRWLDLKPPAEYIGPDNTIRVKLEAHKNKWGEIRTNSLDFEVHGTWQN